MEIYVIDYIATDKATLREEHEQAIHKTLEGACKSLVMLDYTFNKEKNIFEVLNYEDGYERRAKINTSWLFN